MISIKEIYLVFIRLYFCWSIFCMVRTNGIKLFYTKQATVPGKNRDRAHLMCTLFCSGRHGSVIECFKVHLAIARRERSSSETCLTQYRARHIAQTQTHSGNLGKGQSAYSWSLWFWKLMQSSMHWEASLFAVASLMKDSPLFSHFPFFFELFTFTPQIHQRFI